MLNFNQPHNGKESFQKFLAPDPNRFQKLIVSKLGQVPTSVRFSCKSVHNFLSNPANKQTDNLNRLDDLLGKS